MKLLKLHDLHSKHELLKISADEAHRSMPALAWEHLAGTWRDFRKRENIELLTDREKLWARDPWTAFQYAVFLRDCSDPAVRRNRFKEGEPEIAKRANLAYAYAVNVLHGRFKLGEPAIAKTPTTSYDYAMDVLKGPFKLGEPAIAKDGELAKRYAVHVLKAPFPAGEPAIKLWDKKHPEHDLWKDYADAVL